MRSMELSSALLDLKTLLELLLGPDYNDSEFDWLKGKGYHLKKTTAEVLNHPLLVPNMLISGIVMWRFLFKFRRKLF